MSGGVKVANIDIESTEWAILCLYNANSLELQPVETSVAIELFCTVSKCIK